MFRWPGLRLRIYTGVGTAGDNVIIIRQVLADFPGCIISVSHDRLYLSQVCGRVLELTGEGLVPASLN